MPATVRMIIACLLLGWLTGCASLGRSLEPPSIHLLALTPRTTNTLSQDFELVLEIQNPNSRPIDVRGMSYSLALADVKVLEGVTAEVPRLEPYTSTRVELLASANIIGALRFLSQLLNTNQGQSIRYELAANVEVAGFGRRLKVQERGEVPLGLDR